jgi:hypothetical protein
MPSHIPRPTLEAEQQRQELAELVTGVFERTFAAEGREGGLELLRDTLRKLGTPALTELVYAVGAETEPVKEEEEPGTRPRE